MERIQLIEIGIKEFVEIINKAIEIKLADFMKPEDTEDLMTREKTLNLLGVDPSTLWHWQKKGKIKAYGIGNRVYFKRSEIMASLIPLK